MRFTTLMLATSLATACAESSITWEQPAPLAQAIEPGSRLVIAAGAPRLVDTPVAPVAPTDAALCRESLRFARDTTGEWYAAWWSARPDGTAEVHVARSGDGAAWEPAVRVDTVDAGRTGCRRPSPAVDAWGGHVHVAYAMAAREGPGIFATHSMDRGVLFHTPVAVVYGERIGIADIAARGNLVAIAFEDPNAMQDQVGLAYSNTMAHLFQHRETVSPSGGGAREPRIAIEGNRIAVAWTRRSEGAAPVTIVRAGAIR